MIADGAFTVLERFGAYVVVGFFFSAYPRHPGALLPTVSLQASVQQAYEQSLQVFRTFGASAIAQVSVPVYQVGAEYSLIRQSKETLAQQRLVLEQTRDQTRANTVTAWGQLVAGKAQVASAQSRVIASEIALDGVREPARVNGRSGLVRSPPAGRPEPASVC